MKKSNGPAVETDPREALKNTDRRLRSVLKHVNDSGLAEKNEDLSRELKRARRQTRANREILGLGNRAAKKGKRSR